jgi:hypothetical protein
MSLDEAIRRVATRSFCTMPRPRALVRAVGRLLAVAGLSAMLGTAFAQGGPPMVTDDPGTPGDGHWEINLGAIATRTPGRWEIAAPDADINYGWGDHVQLKLDVPWVTSREDGQSWKSGAGEATVGLKWRFVDQEQAGFALSTYPQYGRSMLDSSIRRGITGAGDRFFLPIEIAAEVGGIGIAAEVGRNFVQDGPRQWVAGIVAAHGCGDGIECMAEVHATQQAHGNALTLLNVGTRWKLSDSCTLLASVGHEFGARADEPRQLLAYLGVQLTK